jgi:hypothetical protein
MVAPTQAGDQGLFPDDAKFVMLPHLLCSDVLAVPDLGSGNTMPFLSLRDTAPSRHEYSAATSPAMLESAANGPTAILPSVF